MKVRTSVWLAACLCSTISSAQLAHHTVAGDGAWCWFADPRAAWVDGKLWAGHVTSEGDIAVTELDPRTSSSRQSVLAAKFEKDDHDNPSFLPLPDGRTLIFYSKHTGSEIVMHETRQFGKWGVPRSLKLNQSLPGPGRDTYTYPNPSFLSDSQTVFLTWRGMDWKPTYSLSPNAGKSWSPGRIMFAARGATSSNRPYLKAVSDGRKRVHFFVTDGHPRNEARNSIYHFYFENNRFYRMDGTLIATPETLPVRPEDADVVYDGVSSDVRAWIWDATIDQKGRPYAVYSRLPEEAKHQYHYAFWNGHRWVDRKAADAGGWFPETPQGTTEREPHYSGGIAIDPEDPRMIYVSRPVDGHHEIEARFTLDEGLSWAVHPITVSSLFNNVRPYVPRGGSRLLLWMRNEPGYIHYTQFGSKLLTAKLPAVQWSAPTADATSAARAAAAWQLKHPSAHKVNDWTVAPFLVGLLAFDFDGYQREVAKMASRPEIDWKLGPRRLMADDHAVGQAYLEMYLRKRDPKMLASAKELGEFMLGQPFAESLEWRDGIHNREWAWCDALFMAPPMLARLGTATGDERYFDLLSRLWWKTSDYLYDPHNRLFTRDSRYFESTDPNGAKMFWSRGNGWVLAGLARVLQHLPEDHPDRPKFERQFRDMASRIAELQQPDGFWRSSLLDHETYFKPETSGTGFFCYAMAWGVNNGLLDRKTFEPTVRRAWSALTSCLDPFGRLGWVQPIGENPQNIKGADTEVYGVGAFLLAASEVRKLQP